jgi:hypothetical protein
VGNVGEKKRIKSGASFCSLRVCSLLSPWLATRKSPVGNHGSHPSVKRQKEKETTKNLQQTLGVGVTRFLAPVPAFSFSRTSGAGILSPPVIILGAFKLIIWIVAIKRYGDKLSTPLWELKVWGEKLNGKEGMLRGKLKWSLLYCVYKSKNKSDRHSSNRNKIFWSSCSKSLGWEKTACREKKGTKEKGFLLESVVFADKRKFSGGCFFGSQKNG